MKLRIKFKKYGPIRFIGHLDVMRFYQKALRRAGIDVTYSAGFSPHQVMSFASPLGVGLTSNGEYMDIQVNSLPCPETESPMKGLNQPEGKSTVKCLNQPEEKSTVKYLNQSAANRFEKSPSGTEESGTEKKAITSCDLLIKRLNDASVQGLDAVSARILPENAGNAMASVAAAAYTVRFREGREPALMRSNVSMQMQVLGDDAPSSADTIAESGPIDTVQSAVKAFLAKNEILITKGTKHGVREINLRPGIYELSWQDDAFYMLLDASSAGNIKPVQVITALLADNCETLQENALLITREDLFTDMGEKENHRFISLGDIGFTEIPAEPISNDGSKNQNQTRASGGVS